jgi:N-acetylmuramoyl-L-alanine amidase
VAREVARLLNQIPGYRAVLTRDGDYFISLAKRVRIAKQADGDLFISIHCNTHPQPSTSGMEVYFLSLKGATDREARELANKENAADLVGLAPEERRDDSVLEILMDLRMTSVLNQSSHLAQQVLANAHRSGVVPARRVKQARFQVLSTLAMPSALVELAYLSHSRDRKLLDSRQGQVRLARVLVDGILSYRGEQPTVVALSRTPAWTCDYRVQRGDSLWILAKRYGTTIERIRAENNLRSSRLLVGQTLKLPAVD